MNDYLKQEMVRSLAGAVRRGGHSLGNVPGLLRRVIEGDVWRERQVGETEIQLSEFKAFVEREYPEGLGTTIETLEALCQNEPDIMDFLAQAKRGKHGGARLANTGDAKFTVDARGNVIEKSKFDIIKLEKPATGTSAEYAYNKLRDEAFDKSGKVKNPKIANIHKRVIAGEITPHRGMVEAGLRDNKVSIVMTDPDRAAATIKRYMNTEDLTRLVQLLAEHLADSES